MDLTIPNWIVVIVVTLVCYCGEYVASRDTEEKIQNLEVSRSHLGGFNINTTFLHLHNSNSPFINSTPPKKDERECSSYHKYSNSSNRCTYVKTLSKCHFDEGYITYIQLVYCTFSEDTYRTISYILLALWLLYLFIALGVTAEDFFCPCLKTISKTLRMSDSLAGVTLLALGNGAPDIFSVIAAINNENPKSAELAFQELFGAGIFVTTVVAGTINICATFKMARRPFLRDNIFYLAATTWTFIVIYRRDIRTGEAIGFIALYVLYVSIVIVGQFVNRHIRRAKPKLKRLDTIIDEPETPSSSSSHDAPVEPQPPHPHHRVIRDINETADFSSYGYSADIAHFFNENRHSDRTEADTFQYVNVNDGLEETFIHPSDFLERLTGINKVNWKCQSLPSKIFSVVKVPIVFVLSITCPVVDYDVSGQKWDKWLTLWHCLVSPVFVVFSLGFGMKSVHGELLVYHIILVFGALLALLCYFVTSTNTPRFHSIFALIGFLVAVLWIKMTAQEVVNLLETLGWITGLSYSIMGLSFLAWGNSIGDFISNLTMAKNGAPRMAIAACYGGPLLNMLIGIGISCTISALKSHGHKALIRGQTQYILSALFLAVSLVSAIVILPINRFMSSKYIGIFLLLLYGCYLLVSVLHEVGYVNLP